MICNRCIRAAVRYTRDVSGLASQAPQLTRRNLSSTSRTPASVSPNAATQAAPRQGPPSSSHNPSAATSTSAAQPFSTPLSPSPKNQDLPTPPAKPSQVPVLVKSSCPAGTVLKGLNFIKGKQDPVALEDSEYPTWLWGILNDKEGSGAAGSSVAEGDLFCMSTIVFRLFSHVSSLINMSADYIHSQIQETKTHGSKVATETTIAEPRRSCAQDPASRTDD